MRDVGVTELARDVGQRVTLFHQFASYRKHQVLFDFSISGVFVLEFALERSHRKVEIATY